MRVLVTGGAGYIGAHVVRRLCRRGDEVVVLDDLSNGHPDAIGDVPLIAGSVTDPAAVAAAVGKGVDAVVHLAARKSVEESVADPGGYFATNVGGTLEVLRGAAAANVGALVLSSTAAVYGTPASLPVTEGAAPAPENPYGESKLLAERLLPWFERANGLRWAALRYFNAAGAHPDGDIGEPPAGAANLIPRVLEAAAGRSGPLTVFGDDWPTPDGTAVRDYIHVEDLAEAHVRALDRLLGGMPSCTLNLGTGRGTSVREVLATAAEVVGRTIPVTVGSRRPGDPAAIWADAGAARRRLGWTPTHDLRSMLETAWAWQRSHPDGYGSTAMAEHEPDDR